MAPGVISENEFMLEFIEKYKELECLWKTSDPKYSDKYRRLHCLNELVKVMKKRDPEADVDKVKRKINSMRSSFNRQHRRVMKSRSFVDEDDESYLDNMRYYKSLLFLVDRNPKNDSKNETDTYSEEEAEEIYLEEEFSNEETDCLKGYTKEEPGSPLSGTSTPKMAKQNFVIVPSRSKKRKITNSNAKKRQELHLTDEHEESSSSNKRQFNSFGEHVAERLRCMSKEMAIYCQKIINDAIFHAEIGDLNNTSRVITDY